MNQTLKCVLVALNVHGYTSLALGYLRSSLEANDELNQEIEVETLDLCFDCYDAHQIMKLIGDVPPFLVGFSCYVWNFNTFSELARLINAVWPDTKIVLGGPEVTPHPAEVLKKLPFLTAVIYGEGEETLVELVKVLKGNGSLSQVRGIAYVDKREIRVNEKRPLIEPLDRIPSPFKNPFFKLKNETTYIETYRGCPFKCAYCFEGKNYERLRHFSLQRIKEDLSLILAKGVRSFSFVDPVFNLNRTHLKQIARVLKEVGIEKARLHTIEVVVENLDSDAVAILKEISVESIETGPQAIHPETVRNINRYFNREKFKKGVLSLQKAGIKVILDLIIGLPGDNFYRFLASTAFVFSLSPHRVIFSTLHVLPGTHLFENWQQFDLLFDREAPHYVWQNYSFPYQEIRLAEIMAKSLGKEYNLE